MQVKRSTVSKNLKKLEKFYALQQKVKETGALWNANVGNPKEKLNLTNDLRYTNEQEFRSEIVKLVNFYVSESKNKETVSYITRFTNTWKTYDCIVDMLQCLLHNVGIRNTNLVNNSFDEVSDDNPVYTERELSALKNEKLINNVFTELKKLCKTNYKLSSINVGDIVFYSKMQKSGKETRKVSIVESLNNDKITVIEQGRGNRFSKKTYDNILFNCSFSVYDLRKQIIKHSSIV